MKIGQWLVLTVCLGVIYLVGHQLFSKVVLVTTESIRYSLFLKASGTIERNDYVTFVNPSDFSPEHVGRLVTKQVECIFPQRLMVDSSHRFFCDGIQIGSARVVTREGKTLPVFLFDGEVPLGKAFVMGSHEDSFDSRYFGFINIADAQRVVPII